MCMLTNIKQSCATCLHSLRAIWVNDKLCTNASYVEIYFQHYLSFWCSATLYTNANIIDVFTFKFIVKYVFGLENVTRRTFLDEKPNHTQAHFGNKFCIYSKGSCVVHIAIMSKSSHAILS